MSVPHSPATDTAATAEATSGAVLTPATGVPDGPADLPDTDEAGADSTLEPADEVVVAGGRSGGTELLVREGDVAGDYLERLLDILDVDGDIDLDVEGDRASVAIVGGELDDLVGSDGAVLEALQELTRLAVAQSTGVRSRLMLDIGGYRARRRASLTAMAAEAAERVAGSRQAERLAPMNPFERKVVHDVIAGVAGVRSESEGEEPNRRVVVLPER
ncbi:spoIIIJ-associated protein [Geodermatophilus saharensis]|uniref:SpoIIIJ-associated protein n=1 Tax=Geodermatophilus saharensis TaxID=1137994 RepID=A0A239HD58_9ACTN|nr:R3H domain-containing nucleic acid-binding protein [Geodermatophilus saharensis]SNS79222.1 spoIIIJ-associated protein [Geodermatophilus saharensis]